MPKPTAIRLTRQTVSRISNEFDIPETRVEYDLCIRMNCPYEHKPLYYVKDCLHQGIHHRYLIYQETDFLDHFASVPPGIEENFVPVTQVKDGP